MLTIQVKHKSPRFNQNGNISVPVILEDQHYSDYESGTDDPDSRTNLDQVKVRLSFDSALRSPSMCNVIPDNSQAQEQASSPRKHAVKSKFKSSGQHDSVQSKAYEAGNQKKTKHNGPLKDVNATTDSQRQLKEVSHVPKKANNKKRERKASKIPIPTKELLQNHSTEEVNMELKQNGSYKSKLHRKNNSVDARHRVPKTEKVSTKSDPSSLERTNSPPVPTVAKKLEKVATNSTTNASIHSTEQHMSRRVPARKLYSTSEDIPQANSVVRLHQSLMKGYHQHHEQVRPASPPVPALAKKLEAQLVQKSSLTEFNSHNRTVLPPITNDRPNGVTGLKDGPTPFQTSYNSQQHVLPPVGYSNQPVAEFKSSSPPVPALAKQLSQQQSLMLNHSNNHHHATSTFENHNKRSVSPELNSESHFTCLPEMNGTLSEASEQHSLQQTQPIMYIPFSSHQLPTLYSQCSTSGPVYFQSPQQAAYCVTPQMISSPIQIMIPPFSLSPPQPQQHQQTSMEKWRENGNATFSNESISQPQCTNYTNCEPSATVDVSVQEQSSRDITLPHLPSIVATENEVKDHMTEQSPLSVMATPQLSQEKEAVLQHLAIMKKVFNKFDDCYIRVAISTPRSSYNNAGIIILCLIL